MEGQRYETIKGFILWFIPVKIKYTPARWRFLSKFMMPGDVLVAIPKDPFGHCKEKVKY